MMLSVEDTPFGHALGQFMLLFTRSPLDLEQAHAAFADLSAVAAREHPERAWPLTLRQEDGPPVAVTVAGMLALKRAAYADCQPITAAAVEAAVAPWAGATVRAAKAERAATAGYLLHVELKLPSGQAHWLTAHCPWQVTPAGGTACRWNEALTPLRRALSSLRRAQVEHVRVQPSGALAVSLATGACLLVGCAGWDPREEVADLHYWLQTDDRTFLRVATHFLLGPLHAAGEYSGAVGEL